MKNPAGEEWKNLGAWDMEKSRGMGHLHCPREKMID